MRGCRHATQQARPGLWVMSQACEPPRRSARSGARRQSPLGSRPGSARLPRKRACWLHFRRTMRNHCVFREDVWKTRAKTCISQHLCGRRDFKKRRSFRYSVSLASSVFHKTTAPSSGLGQLAARLPRKHMGKPNCVRKHARARDSARRPCREPAGFTSDGRREVIVFLGGRCLEDARERLRGKRDLREKQKFTHSVFQAAASSARRLRPAAAWGSWPTSSLTARGRAQLRPKARAWRRSAPRGASCGAARAQCFARSSRQGRGSASAAVSSPRPHIQC